MESTIELSVLKKEIHFVKKDSLTTGQQRNSIKISFNGKEWNGLTKYGVFKVEDTVKDVLIIGPDIEIPAEVCTLDNLGKVVYFGIKGTYTETISGTETETVYTTPYFRLGVLERGTETSGSIPEYPTQNAIDAAIENARRWAVGPSSPDKVPTDTNNAKYWSNQAEKFANIFSEAGQLVVKDKYTTLEKLRDANPNHAYTYQVEQPNGELYIYSDAAKDWVSIGAIKGYKGEKGDKGDKGEKGDTGLKGETGATGPQGIQGIKGEKGDTGPQGIQGEKGEIGPAGPQGVTGPQGPQGEKGETGPAGPKGDTGPEGKQGPKGEIGATGPQGEPGPPGKDGVTPEIVEGELVEVPSAGGGTDLSLGITGATVGQIAKITAVDAQGKPTAWEPVDMAGGSEVWELIKDITLGQDVGLVKEQNLGLKKMYITIESHGTSQNPTNNKNGEIRLNGAVYYYTNALSIGDGVTRWVQSYTELIADVKRHISSTNNNNSYQSNAISTGFFGDASLINELEIVPFSVAGYYIGANSRIKIYGVRA